MSWIELGGWWLDEIEDDPAYDEVLTPLLLEVLSPEPAMLYLDLGCGEGRVMRAMADYDSTVIGLDLNHDLAKLAHPTVVTRLPSIPVRTSSVDGAFSVLVLEHLEDHEGFFAEAARVVRPGGVLAVVMNHPIWTAPGSTPISDGLGEVLWRPGDYFTPGISEAPAGEHTVAFHHHSIADHITTAAENGWSLEVLLERSHGDSNHLPGVPRLLAIRWRLLP